MKPWLKITFDPTMPGTAKTIKPGTAWNKRPKHISIPGRWIVFDKNIGWGALYYDSETFEECSAFLKDRDKVEAEERDQAYYKPADASREKTTKPH
jgi:hypothetical protein